MSTAIRKLYMDWIRSKDSGGANIYSSAILADGTHRISIPWGGQRGGTVAGALAKYPKSKPAAEKFVAAFKQKFPELADRVSYKWHVGSCLYLSLRIAQSG